MVAKNDITGDSIQTRTNSKAYQDNYDLIFRKDKKVDEKKPEEEQSPHGTAGSATD